jgi:double zinc ribbon protein
MVAPAIFGITNDGLNLAVKLLLLFLVALWLALVFWTYADARRRIADPMLVTCAAVASFFFPFVGAIVYAIVRPPEYLEDVRERELEIAAVEARLIQVQELACPACGHEVEKTFLRCPNCSTRLKEPCLSCGRPLHPRWQICPYCEAEVPQVAVAAEQQPQRRRARRPERTPAARAAAEREAREREPYDRDTRDRDAREREARERERNPLDRPATRQPRAGREPSARGGAPDPATRVAPPGDGATADQPVRRNRPSADPA